MRFKNRIASNGLRGYVSASFGVAAFCVPTVAWAQTQSNTAPAAISGATASSSVPGPVVGPARSDAPESVTDLEHERDLAIGFYLSSFKIVPTVTAGLEYNSNVFAEQKGRSDVIANLEAKLIAESTWSRNALLATADINRSQHARFGSEDATQGKIDLIGRLDLPSDIKVNEHGSFEAVVEPRTSTGAPVQSGAPVHYREGQAGADIDWKGAHLNGKIGAEVSIYDYDDTFLNGLRVDQQQRDYTQTLLTGRLGYKFDSGREIFVAVERNWGRYRLPSTINGENRDSNGYQFTTGVASQITSLVRGTIGVGYLSEHYAQATTKPVSAVAIAASVDWFASEITTVHFQASRTFENGAASDAFGYLSTKFGARIDQEFLRSLILDFAVSYENAAFRSVARTDDMVTAEVGARYQITRSVFASARAALNRRTSSGVNRAFNYNQADLMASLSLQF